MRVIPRAILPVVLLLGLLSPAAAANGDFGIIGDTKIGVTESVYSTFLDAMKQKEIETIIIVGDATDSGGKAAEWRRLLQLTGSDRTPHVAAGNHDVTSKRTLALYEKMLKRPPYYSFAQDDTLFVVLNTELPGSVSRVRGEQFEWLREELKSNFAHKFVFLHRPLFPTIWGRGYDLDQFKDDRDALHALFVDAGVSLVVSGHEHLYHRETRDDVTYVISGGGGSRLLPFTEKQGGFFHYLVAKKRNGGYLFTVYDLKGKPRDEFSINR